MPPHFFGVGDVQTDDAGFGPTEAADLLGDGREPPLPTTGEEEPGPSSANARATAPPTKPPAPCTIAILSFNNTEPTSSVGVERSFRIDLPRGEDSSVPAGPR
ncbi:hypothetical protein B005_3370 [Nocardiopsis alba ATCC BAA-2165]|uniref:Uncharacterized protein n=1 Tax=Nocardiopsis alba (strain ATCC BAA-2165 / BE74) TaxID=1205910 RepID=J7L4I6_NOCAA|nr:hypothetical protein B005_3370 [Nocardiopsis alba ATCC BAA-2165]